MTDHAISVSGPIETRISLEDLSLEEILEIRRNNRDFVAALSKKLDEAAKDLTEIDTMIKLRMEETGARKFEHAGFRGEYKMIKRGSATIVSAPIARQKLLEIPAVPAHAVDETFTLVTPEPYYKGDLRKFRKLADYGAEAAAIVSAYVVEPDSIEVLLIEEIPPALKDVTPKAEQLQN